MLAPLLIAANAPVQAATFVGGGGAGGGVSYCDVRRLCNRIEEQCLFDEVRRQQLRQQELQEILLRRKLAPGAGMSGLDVPLESLRDLVGKTLLNVAVSHVTDRVRRKIREKLRKRRKG